MEKAFASYREVLENYPDTTWSDLAEGKLVSYGETVE
jgi:hypothetical protein